LLIVLAVVKIKVRAGWKVGNCRQDFKPSGWKKLTAQKQYFIRFY